MKAPSRKEAHGEIETAHPGYLGAKELCGNEQEHRRDLSDLYDTYTKTVKSQECIGDILNDRVLPS